MIIAFVQQLWQRRRSKEERVLGTGGASGKQRRLPGLQS